MPRLIIRNGMILTLDSVGTYFERGTLIIDGDRIVSVDDGAVPVMDQPGDKAIDAADKIVMPGLVDLHYHTALGKGYNDHLPLWEYLDECWYPIVRAVDPEAAYWAALVSYTESIKSGVTTVNDMYRQLTALAQAADDIGIRAVLSSDAALPEYGLDTLADNADAYAANHGKAGGRIEILGRYRLASNCRHGVFARRPVPCQRARDWHSHPSQRVDVGGRRLSHTLWKAASSCIQRGRIVGVRRGGRALSLPR